MESDIKNTIVLDFFGIPGSGKSTESHEIAERYRREGKSVIEASYRLDHEFSAVRRTTAKLLMLLSLPFEKRKRINALAKKNGYNRSNGKLNQAVNVASKLFAVKKYNGKTDYIIFDEGFAQAAISLSVNSKIPADENYREIRSLLDDPPEMRLIAARLSIDEALRRIARRNTRQSRVEAIQSAHGKRAMMKRYEAAAEQIIRMLHEK